MDKAEIIDMINQCPENTVFTYNSCQISQDGTVTTTFELSFYDEPPEDVQKKSVPSWCFNEYPGCKYWR